MNKQKITLVTLVAVTFCCHNSALSYFILNETSDMLQQQETMYFGISYTQINDICSDVLKDC